MSRQPLTNEQREWIYTQYHKDIKPTTIKRKFKEKFGREISYSAITKWGKYASSDFEHLKESPEDEQNRQFENVGVEDITFESLEITDWRKRKEQAQVEYIDVSDGQIEDTDVIKVCEHFNKDLTKDNKAIAFEWLKQGYIQGYKRYNLTMDKWEM